MSFQKTADSIAKISSLSVACKLTRNLQTLSISKKLRNAKTGLVKGKIPLLELCSGSYFSNVSQILDSFWRFEGILKEANSELSLQTLENSENSEHQLRKLKVSELYRLKTEGAFEPLGPSSSVFY